MDKRIMIMIQDGKVVRGELNFDEGKVTFYDKFNNILMRRTGLSFKQMTEIKKQIQNKLNDRTKVGFYYL